MNRDVLRFSKQVISRLRCFEIDDNTTSHIKRFQLRAAAIASVSRPMASETSSRSRGGQWRRSSNSRFRTHANPGIEFSAIVHVDPFLFLCNHNRFEELPDVRWTRCGVRRLSKLRQKILFFGPVNLTVGMAHGLGCDRGMHERGQEQAICARTVLDIFPFKMWFNSSRDTFGRRSRSSSHGFGASLHKARRHWTGFVRAATG